MLSTSFIWFSLLSALATVVCANTGESTFYDPGLGACGIQNTSSDLIVAVAAEFFDTFPGATANPNNNPACKQTLTAHYQGKSVTVMITDKCPGCKGKFDLDLSPAAFQQLSDPSVGRISGVEWSINGGNQRRSVLTSETRGVARDAGHYSTIKHRMMRRRGQEIHALS